MVSLHVIKSISVRCQSQILCIQKKLVAMLISFIYIYIYIFITGSYYFILFLHFELLS